ncbi:MAG TPA: J domain-containing protein [Kofleriaceae bacterium]|nr:J domain-containing protein [Kofleriaceae bacterium]
MAAPKTRRCKYVGADGVRCPRIATIDDELCARCADELEENLGESLLDDIASGRVSVGDVVSDWASGFVKQWVGDAPWVKTAQRVAQDVAKEARRARVDPTRNPVGGRARPMGYGRPGPGSGSPSGSRAGSRPPPPPRPAGPDPRIVAARTLLGFSPTQALTEQAISERRKALARVYHPDKPGGSTEKMQRINAAADLLIAAAGRKSA